MYISLVFLFTLNTVETHRSDYTYNNKQKKSKKKKKKKKKEKNSITKNKVCY